MNIRDDIDLLEDVAEALRAMAHPIRIAIIDLLSEQKELSVTEIFSSLDIQQAVASHHLRIMKSRKLVQVDRQGQNSIYSLSNKRIPEIAKIMLNVVD